MSKKSSTFAVDMIIELKKEQVAQAQDLMHKAQKIVVLTHVAPDGDAMGSALAMYHWLTLNAEREVTVVVPNAFPAFFNWMPGADKILVYETQAAACDAVLASADLFVCTDFNDPKRIHAAGEKMRFQDSETLPQQPTGPISFHRQQTEFP